MTTRKTYTKAQKREYAIKMAKLRKDANGGFAPEMKFLTFQTTDDAFAVTWATMEDATILSVSSVAQGDGQSARDGRQYMIHSIHIRMRIQIASIESQATPLQDFVGRVLLVQDTQTNGAQLTATDVMDGTLDEDLLGFRNLINSKRFRVHWDKSFKIGRQQTNEGAINLFASGVQTTPIYTYNRKFKKAIPVTCLLTTGVIGAISDNSFHIIGIANSVDARLNYQVRIRFTG